MPIFSIIIGIISSMTNEADKGSFQSAFYGSVSGLILIAFFYPIFNKKFKIKKDNIN